MANKFIIGKGLIVSGSSIQPLEIHGTTGQLLSVASSSQGNTFSVNNIAGLPLLTVSGSGVILGAKDYSGSRATTFTSSYLNTFTNITGSATLVDLKVRNYWNRYYYIGEDLEEEEWVTGTGTILQGIAPQIARSIYYSKEGIYTAVDGLDSFSHAEGFFTTASGQFSHAEGVATVSKQIYSHAEGYYTRAFGFGSHAEGSGADRVFEHAQNITNNPTPQPTYCHTQGSENIALGNYSSVQGLYNQATYSTSSFIVGNGYTDTSGDLLASNLIHAYGLASNGIVEIGGSLKVTGGITGSISTTVRKLARTTYTLTSLDSGNEVILSNPTPANRLTDNCVITLPNNLIPGFTITITTTDQTAYIATGSGVQFINNIGRGLGMKSSVTIINTNITNEYLTLGDL